jgi:hypothetical protein
LCERIRKLTGAPGDAMKPRAPELFRYTAEDVVVDATAWRERM